MSNDVQPDPLPKHAVITWPFAFVATDGSSWRPVLRLPEVDPHCPKHPGTTIPNLVGMAFVDFGALSGGRVAPASVRLSAELRWALGATTGAESHPTVLALMAYFDGSTDSVAQFWVDVSRHPNLQYGHRVTAAFQLELSRRCGTAHGAAAAILGWYEARRPYQEALMAVRAANGGRYPPTGAHLPPPPPPIRAIIASPDEYVKVGCAILAQAALVTDALRPDWSSFGNPFLPHQGEPHEDDPPRSSPSRVASALPPLPSDEATEENARHGRKQITDELRRRGVRLSMKRAIEFLKTKGARFETSPEPHHRLMLRLSEYERLGLKLAGRR